MSDYLTSRVLLVGVGYMGCEYAKVLQAQNVPFVAIGRGEERAAAFAKETGLKPITGGLDAYLASVGDGALPSEAIVATSVQSLAANAIALMEHGVRRIFLEKPGAATMDGLKVVADAAERTGAEVYLAYNRRFYASTLAAQEIIKEDGGVTSFLFEFTEWPESFESKPMVLKQNVFFANSSHVVNLAFYLGGRPKELTCYKAGRLPWHDAGASFAGAGITEGGATFSYEANWDAPGRWWVEVLTQKHRLIFRPLEKLQIQERRSVQQTFVDIDDHLDTEFKPGLYREVQAFLAFEGHEQQLCSLAAHMRDTAEIYRKMIQG